MKRGNRYSFVCYLEPSGYGRSSADYLVALHDAGHDLGCRWISSATARDIQPRAAGSIDSLFTECGLTDSGWESLRGIPAELPTADIHIQHCVPELWEKFRVPGIPNVGMTTWETDRLPGHWPPLLQTMDRVVVTSSFAAEVCERSGVTRPVHVIPHIYRPARRLASESVEAFRLRYAIPRDHRVIYSINVWSARKALWDTLSAFLLAFKRDDPVTFVLKTSESGFPSPRSRQRMPVREMVQNLVSNFPDAANIVVIDGAVPDEDIDCLHQLGDCYLSLTRGEGWGLGSFYAAAAGNPVITTGWSGHLDYLGRDYPYLVDYRLVPVVDLAGAPSYSPEQQWARAEIDHAIELLKKVYEDPDTARKRVQPMASLIREKYAAGSIARLFEQLV